MLHEAVNVVAAEFADRYEVEVSHEVPVPDDLVDRFPTSSGPCDSSRAGAVRR